MPDPKIVLTNALTRIEIDLETRKVFGRDLSDLFNEPAFYNRTVRGLKKATVALQAAWTDKTSLHDAIKVLHANGVQTHYWCMVD